MAWNKSIILISNRVLLSLFSRFRFSGVASFERFCRDDLPPPPFKLLLLLLFNFIYLFGFVIPCAHFCFFWVCFGNFFDFRFVFFFVFSLILSLLHLLYVAYVPFNIPPSAPSSSPFLWLTLCCSQRPPVSQAAQGTPLPSLQRVHDLQTQNPLLPEP